MYTVTLIHATPAAMPSVHEALGALTGVKLLNQLDEALLWEIERRGGITSDCLARMECQISLAISADSDVVITTCNAYSLNVIQDIRPRFPQTPVLVVDEPMIREAVQADRVAVLATVEAGLESQRQLMAIISEEETRTPTVTYKLRDDAFRALAEGNPAEHDRVLLEEIERLAPLADVIVLAQASMARVQGKVPASYAGRVLSSPERAAREVRAILDRIRESSLG